MINLQFGQQRIRWLPAAANFHWLDASPAQASTLPAGQTRQTASPAPDSAAVQWSARPAASAAAPANGRTRTVQQTRRKPSNEPAILVLSYRNLKPHDAREVSGRTAAQQLNAPQPHLHLLLWPRHVRKAHALRHVRLPAKPPLHVVHQQHVVCCLNLYPTQPALSTWMVSTARWRMHLRPKRGRTVPTGQLVGPCWMTCSPALTALHHPCTAPAACCGPSWPGQMRRWTLGPATPSPRQCSSCTTENHAFGHA